MKTGGTDSASCPAKTSMPVQPIQNTRMTHARSPEKEGGGVEGGGVFSRWKLAYANDHLPI